MNGKKDDGPPPEAIDVDIADIERPGDPSGVSTGKSLTVVGIPMHRELMRGYVAMGLLLLLIVEVTLSLAVLWRMPDQAKTVTDWLTIVLTPTVALLGAVTGFYYGAKTGD